MDDGKLWDLFNERNPGPRMSEMYQFMQDQKRAARLALHARATEVSTRLVTLSQVKVVLSDDDLDLDFLGADIAGLSRERVLADLRCEESELRRELEDIQRMPEYQAA